MKNTTKITIGVILVLVVVAIGYFAFRWPSEQASTGPIKIGVILPLTGKAANFGEDIKNALEMAVAEVNGESERIKLLIQNDECDPKKAVSAYQMLHDIERVKIIIGSVCSPTTLAIAPLAERDRVVLITPASSAETISEAGDFIFRNHTHDKAEIEKLAPYAITKYKKVAIIYDKTNDGVLLNRKFFTEMFESMGGKMVLDVPIHGGSGDYRTEILKLRPQLDNIDAVFLVTLTTDGVIIVKQMQALDIKKPILANKTFGTSDFVKNVGNELAEGIVYAEAEYNRDTNTDFWDRYLARTGKSPAIWAPQGYDTLKILALILEKCNPEDTACIKDKLYEIKDYPGAAGSVAFDRNGDAIKKIVIKQIQNGNFVKIAE